MAVKALDMSFCRENERVQKDQKDYDHLKRGLKKKILLHDSNKALLPNLKAQVVDAHHQISALKAENKKQTQMQLEVKQQVDLLIARFLKQEDGEKHQSSELDELTSTVASLEDEVAQWLIGEGKQKKLIAR